MMRTVIPEVNKTKDDSYINPIFFFSERHIFSYGIGEGNPSIAQSSRSVAEMETRVQGV